MNRKKRVAIQLVLALLVASILILLAYNDGYGLYLDENHLLKVDKFHKSPVEKVQVNGETYYCLETWDDYFQINRKWIVKPKNLVSYENDQNSIAEYYYNELQK